MAGKLTPRLSGCTRSLGSLSSPHEHPGSQLARHSRRLSRVLRGRLDLVWTEDLLPRVGQSDGLRPAEVAERARHACCLRIDGGRRSRASDCNRAHHRRCLRRIWPCRPARWSTRRTLAWRRNRGRELALAPSIRRSRLSSVAHRGRPRRSRLRASSSASSASSSGAGVHPSRCDRRRSSVAGCFPRSGSSSR
jgi:hypothetical protein